MKGRLLVLAGTFALPVFAAAEAANYECVNGGSTRRVEVAFPVVGETRCEVRYHKDGESVVLWNAQADSAYCETKARDFVAKLREAGWSCANPDAASLPEARDDTDVLEAGSPSDLN
jgi:hypothetical protein